MNFILAKHALILAFIYTLILQANSALSLVSQQNRMTKAFYGLSRLANTSEELADLDRAIKQNPGNAVLYNNRAVLKHNKLNNESDIINYYHRSKSDEALDALADYDKSIRLNANNPIAYINRANFNRFHKVSRAEEVLDDYNKAIELDPKNPTFYELRASYKHSYSLIISFDTGTYFMMDSFGALADYNRAIELNPSDATIYISRGNLKHFYDKVRNLSGALTDYNKAIDLNPTNKIAAKYRDLLKKNEIVYGELALDYGVSARKFFFENSGRHKIEGRKID